LSPGLSVVVGGETVAAGDCVVGAVVVGVEVIGGVEDTGPDRDPPVGQLGRERRFPVHLRARIVAEPVVALVDLERRDPCRRCGRRLGESLSTGRRLEIGEPVVGILAARCFATLHRRRQAIAA
jgi:hypothetical protein